MAKWAKSKGTSPASVYKQTDAPTGASVGDLWVDNDASPTSLSILTVANPATWTAVGGGGASTSSVLSIQNGGSTNDSASGSGAYVNMTPNFSLPTSVLITNKCVRITAHFSFTTGSAPPNHYIQLLAGTTPLFTQTAAISTPSSVTNRQIGYTWLLTGTAAAGAAANVYCTGFGTAASLSATNNGSGVANPIALATNGALTLQLATQWATAGTGTTTITLNTFMVEFLG